MGKCLELNKNGVILRPGRPWDIDEIIVTKDGRNNKGIDTLRVDLK